MGQGTEAYAERDEAEYLQRQRDREDIVESSVENHNRHKEMMALYESNKAIPVGERMVCPSCGTEFSKKAVRQSFCSNKGNGNCKDFFWNRCNERRRLRASDHIGETAYLHEMGFSVERDGSGLPTVMPEDFQVPEHLLPGE